MSSSPTVASAEALRRRYVRVVLLTAAPLVALLVYLGFDGYRQFHARQLEVLQEEVETRREAVVQVAEAARDHVAEMRGVIESRLAGGAVTSDLQERVIETAAQAGPEPIHLLPRPDPQRGEVWGSFVGFPEAVSKRLPDDREVAAALELFNLQDASQETQRHFQWSYFFSESREFVTLYPWAPLGQLIDLANPTESLASYFEYDVFRDGTPELDPEREPYWTPVYLDAAGAGLMVSHASPVYLGDRFMGVVGTDLLVPFLSDFLAGFPTLPGSLLILDQSGVVVARPEEAAIQEADLVQADTLLGFALPAPSAAGTEAFVPADGRFVLDLPIAGTPWRLVQAVPTTVIRDAALAHVAPYLVILVALAATLAVSHLLLRRGFIAPAMRLVQFIERSASDSAAPRPALPPIWQPWADRVAEAAAELRSSEERYRAVVETQTEFVDRVGPDGRPTFVNEAYCRHMGITREQALTSGWSVLDRLEPKDRERVLASWASLTPERPAYTIEHRTIRADGSPCWEQWTIHAIFDSDGRLVETQGVGRDVTQRVLAEMALKESETRLRTIVDSLDEMLMRYRPDGIVTFVNEAYCRYVGRPREELVGHTNDFDHLPPEEVERVLRRLTELTPENPSSSIELRAVHPDGRVRLEVWRGEGVFDASGRLLEYQGVGRDVTEERAAEAEFARQREQLHQAEKLSALGSLLAGVAHELNNPLAVVVAQSTLLESAATDPALASRARKIHAAAERCGRIVKTFLAMVRQQKPVRRATDLNDVVRGAVEMTGYGLRSAGIEVDLDLAPDLPEIHADSDQLSQVVTNLVINAQQVLADRPEPRRLVIRTRPRADGGISLSVADNGPGVPEELRERIFEPYFTTKAVGTGTGIGLSVSRNIVQSHGGTLRLADGDRSGACFRVELPPGEREPLADANGERAPKLARSRILVVDDEPDVRASLGDILEAQGHDVALSDGSASALALIEVESFDAVLCDIRMPGLGGIGLSRAARQRRPELDGRFVFITGDTIGGPASIEALDLAVPPPLVGKPFTARDIAEALAAVIGDRPPPGTRPL